MSEQDPDDVGVGAAVGRRTVLIAAASGLLAACAAPIASSDPSSSSSSPSSPRTTGSGTPPASPDASAPGPAPTRPGGPAREVAHGSRDVDAVALTFHGAGDPALASRVLDVVRGHAAAITVLAVGTWLVTAPEAARRILAEGHELGNHTLHHRPMAHMNAAAAYVEIEGGRRVVARFTDGPTWFRPSGTPHATPAILAAAGRAGYATSLSFDVDPRDYQDPGASIVARRVLTDVRPGSIVSLHLGHAGTAAALPAILDGLARKGLRAVTVSSLLTGVRP
ncbi:MAG TPA: polysaccharide deacetylase family protein [Candidatus Nanopelagicales bacterium]|nr:polysaccharide deacetylase family protein [Candidatus Nanopelagicales bacterium]